jgi:pyridoxal phosphate enzyme (YggS family)
MDTIKKNLLQLQEEIKQKSEHCTPNIIAVTKYFDETKIIEAYEAGLRDFGESRVIEAVEKINKLPQEIRDNSRFHFIGHLQANKVAKAIGNFDLIHSIDSLKLAKVVSGEAIRKGLKQKVLLQVNNAREEQKSGFLKEELFEEFPEIMKLEGIQVVGLMNMAPFGVGEETLRNLFEDVVKIKNELQVRFDCELKEISMGMSGDYKEAVVAGATMIRIGRKLFS